MPREIINVQVRISSCRVEKSRRKPSRGEFLEMLLAEHGLDEEGFYQGNDPLQLTRITTYFDEVEHHGSRTRYVRVVFRLTSRQAYATVYVKLYQP
ncbi:hypothetical protein QCA50_006087 [Cerrena zonata]|uniref:DUF4258 domain-containing protein n=1 Tax=Cerrena zonata TaxID=2478898 RepID=A0AAW0GN12_9APHY